MKRSTFHLLFYIKRSQLRRDGSAPIMGRITINGGAKQFTCYLFIQPDLWDVKANKAIGNSDEAREVNRELETIRKDITKHYWDIRRDIGPLTAERVKAAFFGEDKTCRTLLQVFAQHNEQLAVMKTNKLRSESTYNKYCTVYNHLEKFLASKSRYKDIALTDLHSSFITEFELYLRTKVGCSNNTAGLYMMPLKKMIAISRNNGWLQWNPFADHRISMQRTERNYLTTKELSILINTTFEQPVLELVRDLFLFCCFCGITYADMVNLTTANIWHSEDDGCEWITYKRQKTGFTCNLCLLDIPLQIIKKWSGIVAEDRLLPMLKYESVRYYLKIVIKESGINKHITWHMSRHTFASEICLLNGVPIETISKMLGHTDIKTTQIYAKLSDTIVGRDMATLSKKLNTIKSFSFPTE